MSDILQTALFRRVEETQKALKATTDKIVDRGSMDIGPYDPLFLSYLQCAEEEAMNICTLLLEVGRKGGKGIRAYLLDAYKNLGAEHVRIRETLATLCAEALMREPNRWGLDMETNLQNIPED